MPRQAQDDAEKSLDQLEVEESDAAISQQMKSQAASQNTRRYAALFVLMLQSSMLILAMRYSRMAASEDLYFGSTAVLMNELIKITVCMAKSSYDIGLKDTLRGVFGKDHWKLAIPAALYVLQNNLQYVAASNLDAAAFQVTYQLKILTTAAFSVMLLRRSLKWQQWIALLVLTVGVALVQLPDEFWTHALNLNDDVTSEPEPELQSSIHTRLVGFVAVIIACCLSGLAGVYFEKVLKHSEQVSLWMRNVQLSFYSIFPALFIGVIGQDGRAIRELGFFHGYNFTTVCVIVLQALGGILVALVVKYADNIMKNFATSMSIIVSAVASLLLWGTSVSNGFIVGASLVIIATFWFSKADSK